MRTLVAHAGKLFAGNGYWKDRPGPEGFQGAEILVLDRPDGQWRVDHDFDERMPGGRARNFAIGVMGEVHFATDKSGNPLANPASILLASTWDRSGESDIYARDDATGVWTAEKLADGGGNPSVRRLPRVRGFGSRRDRFADDATGAWTAEEPADGAPDPGFRRLQQVRSFGSHRDRVTGIGYAFAGNQPRGVFSGVYDPTVPGRIRWSETPELDLATISEADFPGQARRLRVTSFAECNDRLYAAVGQQIYERIDGTAPHWRPIYTNRNPGRSQSGLRGLTAAPSPDGQGQVLLAAVEGTEPRIIRFNPRDGSETTDLDLHEFLGRAWGMDVGYMIAAYNDMAEVRDGNGNDVLLIGFEAFIPWYSQVAPGHRMLGFGRGRLEGNAWYLIRRVDGTYDLRRIPARAGQPMVSIPGRPGQPMGATRSIVASPFPADGDAIYFAGFDANKAPVHNTAWIVRSTLEAAIGGSH
jgi:hypothetical protein